MWKFKSGNQKRLNFIFLQTILISLMVLVWLTPELHAQKLDVAYVPTPHDIVGKMLDVANVGPGDYVIDLGSGDGRMVIAAAKRGAFGHGVDLDPERVREGKANAREADVEDRVTFIQENIYETDFSMASVIVMYLFPTINIKLRPALLEKLEPGTRVVSHDFDMDYWMPDKYIVMEGGHEIYFWIIPADAAGTWSWRTEDEEFQMDVGQEFQKIEVTLKSGDKSLEVDKSSLKGKRISFLTKTPSGNNQYVYSGRVEGDYIIGTVQVHSSKNSTVKRWTARRH